MNGAVQGDLPSGLLAILKALIGVNPGGATHTSVGVSATEVRSEVGIPGPDQTRLGILLALRAQALLKADHGSGQVAPPRALPTASSVCAPQPLRGLQQVAVHPDGDLKVGGGAMQLQRTAALASSGVHGVNPDT